MSRMFVQLDVGFANSELVDQARTELGLDTDSAIGKLARFFEAVLTAKCDGVIGHRSDSWMEEVVAWRGEVGRFAAFVRNHMIDAEGIVKGWDERYGALNRKRARDQKSQLAKRGRDGQLRSTNSDADVSADVSADDGADVGARSGRTSAHLSLTSSSLLSVAFEQENEGQQQGDHGKERADPLDPVLGAHRLVAAEFGSDWPFVEGLIRSARVPASIAATIRAHLDGVQGPAYPALIIARAAREFQATGEKFNARYFAGFLRDSAKQVQVVENRERTRRETQHIDREVVERERVAHEEAQFTELLAHFERTRCDDLEKLKSKAESMVDRKWPPIVRGTMVRAALIKLIRDRLHADELTAGQGERLANRDVLTVNAPIPHSA